MHMQYASYVVLCILSIASTTTCGRVAIHTLASRYDIQPSLHFPKPTCNGTVELQVRLPYENLIIIHRF